jgi:hypothetical protein
MELKKKFLRKNQGSPSARSPNPTTKLAHRYSPAPATQSPRTKKKVMEINMKILNKATPTPSILKRAASPQDTTFETINRFE